MLMRVLHSIVKESHFNLTRMIFIVVSSWQSHCESSPGSPDECRLSAEVAANPQTKPTNLDYKSARKKWQLPSTSTITIYYYSAQELILILRVASCLQLRTTTFLLIIQKNYFVLPTHFWNNIILPNTSYYSACNASLTQC